MSARSAGGLRTWLRRRAWDPDLDSADRRDGTLDVDATNPR